MRKIVVTGVGLVTPLGVGVRSAWPRLLAGGCGVRRVEALQGLPSEVAAIVPRVDGSSPPSNVADRIAATPFDPEQCRFIARGDERTLAPFVQFALTAAAEALDSAQWAPTTRPERERTGVAIGSGIGSLEDIAEATGVLRDRGVRRVSPYFIPRMLVNMAAGQVSIRAGLLGPQASPSTACATGAHAISDASHLLASGAADVMVAGGAEACVVPLAVAGFSRLRALSTQYNQEPHAASRPFDESRDGFVLGEGAAVLVLETEEHARRRGATILAELCGVGLSSDAHHITSPPEDGDGALRAMRAALTSSAGSLVREGVGGEAEERLRLAASRIDYVNAHATSTPAGDEVELRALGQIAAQRAADQPPLLVSSTKGATGHLLGAAGAVEAAFTVLALHHQRPPPTINLEAPVLGDVPGVAHVSLANQPVWEGRPLRAALCNSFGFGGVNASLCFQRWQAD